MGNLAWYGLYDPMRAQEAYAAWLDRDRTADSEFRKWFEGYVSEDDNTTTVPLEAESPSAPDAGTAYSEYMRTKPDDWSSVHKAIEALENAKDYGRAREIATDWLRRNGREAGFPYIHAHSALGIMYLHEGQYKRALRAVEPVVGSGAASPIRIQALSLIRLGRFEEAEPIAKNLVVRYPDSLPVLMAVGELYLRTGRGGEFADLLKAYPYTIPTNQWSGEIAAALFDAFQDEDEKILLFCRDLQSRKFGRLQVGEIGEVAARKGKPELAVEILSGIPAGSLERALMAVRCYAILRESQGADSARKWLQGFVPANLRTTCSVTIYHEKFDDLLWELYGETPIDDGNENYVRLLLAAAHLRQGETNSRHRQLLTDYFKGRQKDYYDKTGQYLLGQIDEKDLLREVTDGKSAMEIGYFMGLKAETEGRFRDAVRYYRVSAESALRRDGEYHWSRAALIKILDRNKSVDVLEARAKGSAAKKE
jgi:tetratricopeptide (TPR) repeat protein